MGLLKKIDQGIENLSIGLGYGLQNQLEGMYQMARHPIQAGKGLLSAGKAVAQDPTIVAGLLANEYRRGSSGLLGLGEVVGENLSPRSFVRPKPMRELTTYHGSPHRINNVTPDAPYGKFDMSKIGSGEGAQAYGHGIYLAENPRVAKEYAEKLSVNASWPMSGYNSVEKANPGLLQEIIAAVGDDPSRINRAVIKPTEFREIGPDLKKRINAFKKDYRGNFYTVDLPDEQISKMLDWDAPLSEQPEAVREALESAGIDWQSGVFRSLADRSPAPMTGKDAYEALARQAAGASMDGKLGQSKASELLRSLGIPGIRYFDGGSRKAGEGTRNFVIFDGDTAKILKRE